VPGKHKGKDLSELALTASDSLRQSSLALAAALVALVSVVVIRRSYFFTRLSALRAAVASFLSSAALALESFSAFWSAASWVLV